MLGLGLLASAAHFSPPTDECAFRKLTYETALLQQPDRAPLLDVFDGLELEHRCQEKRPAPVAHKWPSFPTPTTAAWYVSVNGSDSGDGSSAHPFLTVARAVAASRAVAADKKNRTILLRAGVHHLSQTIALDTRDNGLTVQNYEGEEAWLSGGVPLHTEWKRWQPAGGEAAASCEAQCKKVRQLRPVRRLHHQRLDQPRHPPHRPGTSGAGPRARRRDTAARAPPPRTNTPRVR